MDDMTCLLTCLQEERGQVTKMLENIKQEKLDVIKIMHSVEVEKDHAFRELDELRCASVDEVMASAAGARQECTCLKDLVAVLETTRNSALNVAKTLQDERVEVKTAGNTTKARNPSPLTAETRPQLSPPHPSAVDLHSSASMALPLAELSSLSPGNKSIGVLGNPQVSPRSPATLDKPPRPMAFSPGTWARVSKVDHDKSMQCSMSARAASTGKPHAAPGQSPGATPCENQQTGVPALAHPMSARAERATGITPLHLGPTVCQHSTASGDVERAAPQPYSARGAVSPAMTRVADVVQPQPAPTDPQGGLRHSVSAKIFVSRRQLVAQATVSPRSPLRLSLKKVDQRSQPGATASFTAATPFVPHSCGREPAVPLIRW